MQKNSLPNPEKSDKKKSSNRFIDVGWRMLVIVLVGTFTGWFLDKQFPTIKPWGTFALSIIAVIGSMYLIIKEASRK